ncbi:DUF3489 domain-containing protein [Sphingomonas sp. M1-B02]|uniref:DUF3489 domain-containing protein n=1 Tax=Sphingomonas sp. M1-B02 TaxID=3114300 RepID=UPI0022408AD5|nr:DUF3489 domain-containing protein [Sphingomonas sp. S6-11]UZK65437.1 DUF3489 domain-containing protein [Sphingomonas sp. S6-11]
MTELTDTQLILLAHGAQHPDGSLYPLPARLNKESSPKAGTTKPIEQLLGRGLIEERGTSDPAIICRTDGDLSYGMFITALGLAMIGVDDGGDEQSATPPISVPTPAKATKSALVLSLLARADGATLPELIEATGWLPHTTRAALTGLRKKGHSIERSKRGADTCYRIAA